MRISTSAFFQTGANKLSELQSTLMRTQQQIASGRRMLTPADDPVAAARAFDITQAQAANTQYATNRLNLKSSLEQEESVLQSVTNLLQDIKTLTVNAGNGSLDDAQRKYLAVELRGRFDDLLGLANSTDGSGEYLFSGFQSSGKPFAASATGAIFNGDQGQRELQAGAARYIAMGDSGTAVFEQIKTGNGTFLTGAAGANTGSGIISAGTVVNSAALTGNDYSVVFSVVGGVTTYDIVNTTTSATLSTGNAYVDGQAITFDGMQFEIKGSPADGDTFSVQPSRNQSVFTTLKDLIAVLEAPALGSTNQARLTNGLVAAGSNLDNAIDNMLTVRASVGIRLRELDSLDSAGEDRGIQYAQTLAALQDLDYTQAITSLTQQQITLTAAQQSFAKTSNLSLFNFLS